MKLSPRAESFDENKIEYLDYLMLVREGNLRQLRSAIRGCIEFESFELKNKQKNLESDLYYQVYAEIVCKKVQNLLLETRIVRCFVNSKKRHRKITYPLSGRWIEIFEKSGIGVNRVSSVTYYKIHTFRHLIKRYVNLVMPLRMFVSESNQQGSKQFLLQVMPDFIGEGAKVIDLFNFTSWVKKQNFFINTSSIKYLDIRRKNFRIRDSLKSKILKYDLQDIFKQIISLFLNNPFQFIYNFFIAPNLIFNYCSINKETLDGIKCLVIPSSAGWIKATWHLKTEELGVKIIFVNLSNSGEPSITFDDLPPVTWAPLSTWHNMTICSDYQREHIFKIAVRDHSCKFDLVGVPDWIDCPSEIPMGKLAFFSIFDFEPHVGNYGFSSINDSGYSDVSNAIMFVQDLAKIAFHNNIKCVLKSKRKISSEKRFKVYDEAINNIVAVNNCFVVLDESIAPRRIIQNSIASIHMPFTSTALIGKQLSIPSCFYDPVGLISLNDPAACQIEIIKDPHHLELWLKNQIRFNVR